MRQPQTLFAAVRHDDPEAIFFDRPSEDLTRFWIVIDDQNRVAVERLVDLIVGYILDRVLALDGRLGVRKNSRYRNDKSGPHSLLALNFDLPTMIAYHLFNVAQSESMPFHIVCISLGHPEKLVENFLLKFGSDTFSLVRNG